MEHKLIKVLAVLVNYGTEQIHYLEKVVNQFKQFKKYEVTIIINSNIPLEIEGVNKINVIKLEDYQLLPLTCRQVIHENKHNFDVFVYGENDHLFLEKHIDSHLLYSKILPKNRISGLIQYEEDSSGKYYPGYHLDFEWDFSSIEIYGNKKFAYFNNVHQASFILTKEQLLKVSKKINFTKLVNENETKTVLFIKKAIKKVFKIDLVNKNKYSIKCKVNTDVYLYGGMKKMICISDFEDSLIHHLPNLYIEGSKGRNKFRSDSIKMENSIKKLLAIKPNKSF